VSPKSRTRSRSRPRGRDRGRSPARPPGGATAPRWVAHLLVTLGGAAALSWETLWQLEAALSLGVSAFGTALTLATTMAGMTTGSLLMGAWLGRRAVVRPLALYGALELAIGALGLLLRPGLRLVEAVDTQVYAAAPGVAPLLHALGIAAVLGAPALAMGATVPVFQRIAARYGTSVSRLYGQNTAGAALGTLALAFAVVPAVGVVGAVLLTTATNVAVAGAAAWTSLRETGVGRRGVRSDTDADTGAGAGEEDALARRTGLPPLAFAIVLTTGFATFALEVAWFRSLLAAFQSTTESFALILVSVLAPLALAASQARRVRRAGAPPGALLGAAAVAILLATPLVERVDLLAPRGLYRPDVAYGWLLAQWLGLSLAIVGPPVALLGTLLPLYLDRADAAGCGRLYAVNTAGAVAGSLAAAWLLVPALGVARASWLVAGLVAVPAAFALPGRLRLALPAAGLAALAVAVTQSSSLGRERVQTSHDLRDYAIVAFEEDPDSTVSVVETPDGRRRLLIDGFTATSENDGAHTSYMAWMGRLPVLLHDDPRRALVIAFGTGQTAAALLDEAPAQAEPLALDVVDVSAAVLRVAPHFASNDGVLDDPRVRATVMDGRAWVRRVDHRYDLVTLEPMPPYFKGVNALYAREFYELVARRLTPEGVVAQWLPFHLLTPDDAASVARTFVAAFPDALLWVDPAGGTGILLGREETGGPPLGAEWPGLARAPRERGLAPEVIRGAALLRGASLHAYARRGEVITDANQLLAYGLGRGALRGGREDSTFQANLRELVRFARAGGRPAVP